MAHQISYALKSEQIISYDSKYLINPGQKNQILSSFSSISSTSSSFIYVTDDNTAYKRDLNPLNTVLSEDFDDAFEGDSYVTLPLFFNYANKLVVPKKVIRHLNRKIPIEYLKNIDSDKTIAIEKCLLIVSSLTSTVYADERWKELSSLIMDLQTKKGKDNTRIYTQVLNVLKFTTNSTEAIIRVKTNSEGYESYQEGICCKSFRLNDSFFYSGLTEYTLKSKDIIGKRSQFFYSQLAKAQKNSIARNLIELYSRIILPSHTEMINEAKRLTKIHYRNKKGKKLTFLNKNGRMYFKDPSQRSFVEDNIKLYCFLTKLGFLIPNVGGEKSGGRVVDSFALMPSWIRRLVKIDGEEIVEVDFKALHPNIAMSIYGGRKKYLTHASVANEININKDDVKVEHLSFFNKTQSDMKQSELYNYYESSEPQMLKAIEQDKWESDKKHKITSMKLFAKEVEIMTECIRQLNALGIYVGYVYDALFCKKSEAEIVKAIMDKVIVECNVYSTAEINY